MNKDKKPLSPFAFRSVLGDYKRKAMPKGISIRSFLSTRAISPRRFYPTFIEEYREEIERVLKDMQKNQGSTVNPDRFIASLTHMSLIDGDTPDVAEAMSMLETMAQGILESERQRAKTEELERQIREFKQIEKDREELRADIDKYMEEYTRLLDKIPRLSQSSDSGGANDEEAAVIIDRYYDTKEISRTAAGVSPT